MESRVREILIRTTEGHEAPPLTVESLIQRREVRKQLTTTVLVSVLVLLVPASIFAMAPKLLLSPQEAPQTTGQPTVQTQVQGPTLDPRPARLEDLEARISAIGYLPPGFREELPRANNVEVVRFFRGPGDASITLRQEDVNGMIIMVADYDWKRTLEGPTGPDSAVLFVLKDSPNLLRIRWAAPIVEGRWRNFELIGHHVQEAELIKVFRSMVDP